jgi:plasmid maintenance system antidote protein VapI
MVLEITSPKSENHEIKVRKLSKVFRLPSEFIEHICRQNNLSIAQIEKAIKLTKSFGLTASEVQ